MNNASSFNSNNQITSNQAYYEMLYNWLNERPNTSIPISINISRLIYRMTLGSVYYDLDTKVLKLIKAQEPTTSIAYRTKSYLQNNFPLLLNQWNYIKNETNLHLNSVLKLIDFSIIKPVNLIIEDLKKESGNLQEYKSGIKNKEYYVKENIIETLYQELQHYSALKYKLNFFKIDESGTRVGNGSTYLVTLDKKILSRFILSINDIIEDEQILSQYRSAEIRKLIIESKVFDFKNDLCRFLSCS